MMAVRFIVLLLLLTIGCGARTRPILRDVPRSIYAWRTIDESALALMWLVLMAGLGFLLVMRWRRIRFELKDKT